MSQPKKFRRLGRFSIRGLIVFTLLIASLFGLLIFRASERADAVAKLRQEGALVRIENQPPWPLSLLKNVNWGPIFDFPSDVTIAAVIDDEGNVQIGDDHLPFDSAKERILEQLHIAKTCGAKRIGFNGCHCNGKFPDLDLQLLKFAAKHDFAPVESGHWYFYRRDWEFQNRTAETAE